MKFYQYYMRFFNFIRVYVINEYQIFSMNNLIMCPNFFKQLKYDNLILSVR